jgi:hypothetical protein
MMENLVGFGFFFLNYFFRMSKMLRSDAKVVPLDNCQSLAPTGKDKDLGQVQRETLKIDRKSELLSVLRGIFGSDPPAP